MSLLHPMPAHAHGRCFTGTTAENLPVIPAQAGIQKAFPMTNAFMGVKRRMDSGLRRIDGVFQAIKSQIGLQCPSSKR